MRANSRATGTFRIRLTSGWLFGVAFVQFRTPFVFDEVERLSAIIERSAQHTVATSDVPRRTRSCTIAYALTTATALVWKIRPNLSFSITGGLIHSPKPRRAKECRSW